MENHSLRFTAMQIKIFIITGCLLLCMAVVAFIKIRYEVTTVVVNGNVHYTDEEIADMLMQGALGKNSIYLDLKYRNKNIADIPFIDTMDVKIVSSHEIEINVYEKAVAGYVKYLGYFMYFDRDGVVVESSSEAMPDIPYVTGLQFSHVILHQKLPVESDEIFRLILYITQLLTKYEVVTEKIYFSPSLEITLFFGDMQANLGSDEGIDEKIMKLRDILPELKAVNSPGILHLENYSEESKYITFEKNDPNAGQRVEELLIEEDEAVVQEENMQEVSEENQ